LCLTDFLAGASPSSNALPTFEPTYRRMFLCGRPLSSLWIPSWKTLFLCFRSVVRIAIALFSPSPTSKMASFFTPRSLGQPPSSLYPEGFSPPGRRKCPTLCFSSFKNFDEPAFFFSFFLLVAGQVPSISSSCSVC